MEIITGIINKVFTEDQFELVATGKIAREDIELQDTTRTYENNKGDIVEYLPIRISSKDVDKNGKDKYIFDEEKNEYQISYTTTQILNVYGKEMRIIKQLGEYAPVKVVIQKDKSNGRTYSKVVCVQDQTLGII